MSPDLLLSHFNRVSDAPDAVARLRRSVLDLAVRGKLVEQAPSDQHAAELVQQVRKQLTNVGVTTEIVPVQEEEAPFQLPSGWAWSRIGEVCSKTGSGSTPRGGKAAYQASGIPFLRSQNVHDDGLRLDEVAYIDVGTHARMAGTHVRPRDLLLNITGGSIGRCCRVPDEFGTANVSQHVAILRPALPEMADFLHLLVRSPYFQQFIQDEQTGAGRGGLPKGRMDRIVVAIPPLSEQQRIVRRVHELMALCDQLEAERAEREAIRDRLMTATLARINLPDSASFRDDAAFMLDVLYAITERAEQVAQIREAILNLAVRGELVPRQAADQPAADLILRLVRRRSQLVEASAAARSKANSRDVSRTDSILPASWTRVTLGELCSLITSGPRGWAEHYAESGPGFVRAQNVRFGELRLDDLARVNPPQRSEGSRTQVATGDLFVVITGAGVTNPALLDREIGEAYVSQHVALIRPLETELSSWLLLCLMAPAGCRSELVERAYGAGKPGLNLDNIRSLSVPIPPLAEQQRILKKVAELMALCDQMEESIVGAERLRGRLLDALLHQLLDPPGRIRAA
jgi:type I restriction enzyme, S subunit